MGGGLYSLPAARACWSMIVFKALSSSHVDIVVQE